MFSVCPFEWNTGLNWASCLKPSSYTKPVIFHTAPCVLVLSNACDPPDVLSSLNSAGLTVKLPVASSFLIVYLGFATTSDVLIVTVYAFASVNTR